MTEKATLSANTRFDKADSVAFLTCEYQQCFEHMRHYDNVESSLMKFAFTGFLALASATSALFKYLDGKDYRELVLGGLLLAAFPMAGIVLTMMVRNRSYFVIVARQVNSLRNYFLNNAEIDFIKYNKAYVDPYSPPNFNLLSTYTLMIGLIALLNGALAGASAYLLITYFLGTGVVTTLIASLIALALVVLQLNRAVSYLRDRDQREADRAIFPQMAGKEEASGQT